VEFLKEQSSPDILKQKVVPLQQRQKDEDLFKMLLRGNKVEREMFASPPRNAQQIFENTQTVQPTSFHYIYDYLFVQMSQLVYERDFS
jgi:hypothetical protein